MSFASDVRGELARLPLSDACCARSELTAALLSSGGIAWRGHGRYALSITAADAPTVRRYFGMLKQFWGVVGQIRTVTGEALQGQTRYQLAVPQEESLRLLEELRLLDASALFGVRQIPAEQTVRFACCRKAFVRAAFLMCGAISNPEKQYHMEIAVPTEPLADFIAEQLDYFEINVKKTCRKSKYVVYLKRAEVISDALTLVGASGAMLAFENVRIKKEVGNRVNRQLNCDQSNIDRVMGAAEAQIADIQFIDGEVGLEKLPKSLRAMAEARLGNPEATLAELGELLTPPIGKSGVNARLRRIADIAEKLRCGEALEM